MSGATLHKVIPFTRSSSSASGAGGGAAAPMGHRADRPIRPAGLRRPAARRARRDRRPRRPARARTRRTGRSVASDASRRNGWSAPSARRASESSRPIALSRSARRRNATIADGLPHRNEAYFARSGQAQAYDILALPVTNRWGPDFVAVHLAERGTRYSLVDAAFHASDDGMMAFAVVHDDARRPTDFQIIELNAAAAKLVGMPADRLRWRRLGEEGLGFAAEPLARGLRRLVEANGERERFELALAAGGGAPRYVGVSLTRMGDLVCAALTDLTALKQREESYRLLFEANPVPMWIVDARTRRFLSVNDAAVEHFGYAREQFLVMSADDLRVAEESRPTTRKTSRAPPRRPPARAKIGRHERHRRADGEAVDALTFARYIAYDGRPAQLVAIVDITERRRAEAEAAYLARHDALTGLSNRADFREHLMRAIESSRRRSGRLAVAASISTCSRTSTTPSAIRPATGCCAWSPSACATRLARAIWRRGTAATNSPSSLDPVATPAGVEATVRRLIEALSQP